MAIADDGQAFDGAGQGVTDFSFDAASRQDDVIALQFVERGDGPADDEMDTHLFDEGYILVDGFW